MNRVLPAAILVLAGIAFYFSGVVLEFTLPEQAAVGGMAFAALFLAARRNLREFFVTALAAFSTAASLGCAFLNHAEATGPLAVDIRLAPWFVVAAAALVAGHCWRWQAQGASANRFAGILLALFVLNWVILAFNVRFYGDWKIENWLTVPFVVLIYLTHRWFRFSHISYGLIFVYMMLHIYGSHYTYAEVPFGFWMQDVLGASRNHYDRIVHFSFGFLLAYPIREMVVRISNTKGLWSYWFPIEFAWAFSAIYEIMEWGVAVVFGGDLGVAYLGTQGDVWDAQKDMFLAGCGSVIAMLVVAVVVWHYQRDAFWRDLRESVVVKNKRELGEVALEDMKNNARSR